MSACLRENSHEGSRILQWFASSSTPNPVARAVRPVTLGRTNHVFAGSDGGGARWTRVCSLIETTRLNGVEPYAYLSDVLRRMVDGTRQAGSTSCCRGAGSPPASTPNTVSSAHAYDQGWRKPYGRPRFVAGKPHLAMELS